MKYKRDHIYHRLFKVSVIIKGVDGMLETIGGLLIILFRSENLFRFVRSVFRHELIEDPNDFVANYLTHLAQTVSLGTLYFSAVYLLVHGLVKISLVIGLWRQKLWAYPAAGIVLIFFVIYQIIRLINTYSILLLFLTIIDVIIIFLLHFEYRRIKSFIKH